MVILYKDGEVRVELFRTFGHLTPVDADVIASDYLVRSPVSIKIERMRSWQKFMPQDHPLVSRPNHLC
jgi:hypothetical protein